MERDIMKIKMESVNGLEMKVDKFEKILISHQQETEKLKKIKTEEALKTQIVAYLEKDMDEDAYLQVIHDLQEEIRQLKLHSWMDKETIKEIMQKNAEANQMVEELSRKISASEDAEKMSNWIQEDMKRRELENVRYGEDLRRKNLEASRSVEELRRRLLAYEEEKKTASRVQEEMVLRELENIRCVEDLRRKNMEANRKMEELRNRVLAFEEDKKTANLVLKEMKIKEKETFRCFADLRQKKSEADRKVEELGDRVLALEEEKMTAIRDREEMKVRETDSKRRLEGLERQKLEAYKRMNEMKVRELDLRREILEADDRVKELKGQSLEACKTAEVNIKRFGNVLPIAEELCKLLKMNVEDLVSVKDKFVWGVDEEALISSSVVSTDSSDGAITTNGVAGPHASNKAVEELTASATKQPTKKRQYSHNKTQTTPSSAAINDIIDCDAEDFFSSGSYEISPVIPKKKRSKRAVRVNKSLIKRKWMFGEDMERAFEEDDELCLHAVCAIYRQHVSPSQSTESSNKRFYHFEALRGSALADYLINGDPELSLTRPVDEVKLQYPDIVNQCRRLAICYSSYFTAMPRTNEPLSRSLSLVCCHRYVPTHTHVGGCGTYCGVGEGEVMEL